MTTWPLLRNRDYMLLWSGQVISTLGSAASAVIYPLLILALTGSPAAAGLAAARMKKTEVCIPFAMVESASVGASIR